MDVPISISDIEYLLDAAETISTDNDIPKYISYRLFREAQQRLLIFGDDENAARLHERICQGFGDLKLRCVDVSGGPVPNYTDDEECPEKYENWSLIQILVDIYGECYDAKNENDGVEGSSETRERILTTSKALRTALKMLTRVERGDTSEEDFIRKNGIPKEFVQDTEYDEGSNNIIESSSTAAATDLQASRVNANMDVPSKRDIEYFIDAAERILFMNYIPFYIPCRLFDEAREMLKKFKKSQTLLNGHAENTVDLESRISMGLPYIIYGLQEDHACPEDYKKMTTIQILVDIYGKYHEKVKEIFNSSIDELREEDEKHKKWGSLNPNFQNLTR